MKMSLHKLKIIILLSSVFGLGKVALGAPMQGQYKLAAQTCEYFDEHGNSVPLIHVDGSCQQGKECAPSLLVRGNPTQQADNWIVFRNWNSYPAEQTLLMSQYADISVLNIDMTDESGIHRGGNESIVRCKNSVFGSGYKCSVIQDHGLMGYFTQIETSVTEKSDTVVFDQTSRNITRSSFLGRKIAMNTTKITCEYRK
jgi:hypothetical protein